MDNVILIRYSEIHLKGKNRSFFENLLKKNLSERLSGIKCTVTHNHCRYTVSDYSENDEREIERRIKQVFGIFSYSKARRTTSDIDGLIAAASEMCRSSGTFRITVNRAEKRLAYTSVQLAAELGSRLLKFNEKLSVDLHNPDFTVFVDVRSLELSFVYGDSVLCAGGLPVGCSGKGLTLLSGGIDSPVAAYMVAKRGMKLSALHFWSYPYTNMQAKQKVVDLAKKIADYNGNMCLYIASLTKMQEAIHEHCEPNYMITLVRRAMMRVAETVSEKYGLQCIINGESLGQVASQTVESITVTNSVIKNLPVFRPLIGMDKVEIVSIAQKIDTYETSILPYEDCCTVFLPDSPVTKPSLRRAEHNESRIPDYDKLIGEIIDNLEIISV